MFLSKELAKKKELGDMTINSILFYVPSVEEFMKSPLAKFTTLCANDYGYSESDKDLIENWVHPLQQVKKIIQLGDKPCVAPLQTNTGKLPSLRLKL